jgi:thioesterase III
MKTTLKIKIRGYHMDFSNHVNNARYLEFLEEGRWDYSDKNNLTDLFQKNKIGHATVRIDINYRRSAFIGDVLRVETNVLKTGGKSVTMLQTIFLNNTTTLIADTEVTNVYLDLNTGKVIPIDKEFIMLWPDLSGVNNREHNPHSNRKGK